MAQCDHRFTVITQSDLLFVFVLKNREVKPRPDTLRCTSGKALKTRIWNKMSGIVQTSDHICSLREIAVMTRICKQFDAVQTRENICREGLDFLRLYNVSDNSTLIKMPLTGVLNHTLATGLFPRAVVTHSLLVEIVYTPSSGLSLKLHVRCSAELD